MNKKTYVCAVKHLAHMLMSLPTVSGRMAYIPRRPLSKPPKGLLDTLADRMRGKKLAQSALTSPGVPVRRRRGSHGGWDSVIVF